MLVYWIALAVLFPGLRAALTFFSPFRVQLPTTDNLPDQPFIQETMTEKVDSVCHYGPEKRYRFSYGSGPGVDIYGWPSKGGVYVLHNCLGVELDFLGYNRFDLPVDLVEPQPEEDAHCDLMRRLGATWWKRYDDMVMYKVFGPDVPQDRAMDEVLHVGWPETGGVWVLHTTVNDARRKGIGLLGNAYTMQERCMMIEWLGGVFYDDRRDCPYLDLPPPATPIKLQA